MVLIGRCTGSVADRRFEWLWRNRTGCRPGENGTQLTLRDVPAYESARRVQPVPLKDSNDESESVHHSWCPEDAWLACAICGQLWKRAGIVRSDFERRSKRQILVVSA